MREVGDKISVLHLVLSLTKYAVARQICRSSHLSYCARVSQWWVLRRV